MLLKAVEERAEKNRRKVFYVEVDVLSENQKYVELHKQMGYTCHKEYFDIIEGEMYSGNICQVETCISKQNCSSNMTSLVQQKLQQSVASKTGLLEPSCASHSNEICVNNTHTRLISDSGTQ
ncbi:uncharacterized protein LOC113361326 isoform X1 [Papaver somniferum]|uniref:uncharacterized protein LOC113361326 isoform X1 n=1 Tax=Papaver somniferum TaxID=3469 RepID=UPI000E70230A|nr:uncharacterized protein LOC113361326 isoform X1 [Papaver somniferum]